MSSRRTTALLTATMLLGTAALGAAVVTALAIAAVGCVPPRSGVGTQCELNSQCATPLVCRLGACRHECVTSEDCAAGLSCVLDLQHIGACQLEAERSCALDSECPTGLVCRFEQCTNACETDRDCTGGARCEADGAGRACVDRSTTPCNYDSDCDVRGGAGRPQRCVRQRCRSECFTDRDCRNDYWCDVSESVGSCLPLPRFARPDAGSDAVGSASDDTGPSAGCVTAPVSPAWTATLPGITGAVATYALVGRRLIVIEPDDFTVGAGGDVDVLDLDAHTWSGPYPFPEARLRMNWIAYGAEIAITGGYYSTPGGDPLRDVVLFDPLTGITRTLGAVDAEPRISAATAVCGTRLVSAGGDPGSSMGYGSALIALRDLSSAGTTTGSLPEPMSQLAAIGTATHVYLAGGVRDLMWDTNYPSDTMFVVDCADGSSRQLTMPHFYAGSSAAEIGGRFYFSGLRTDDGTTLVTLARGTSDTLEVFDPGPETWTSLDAPPLADSGERLPVVAAGAHLARSAGFDTQVLDTASGRWACWGRAPAPAEGLLSDGTRLYLATRMAGTITIAAYDVD